MKRLAAAGAASFLVYLIPLVGPHTFWILGEYLLDAAERREGLWLAADVAVALAAQAVLFLALWRLRGAWRVVTGVALLTVGTWALNLTLLVVVPTWFLVEAEPEGGAAEAWPVACRVENASLMQVRAGVALALERAGRAVLRPADDGAPLWLQADCATTPAGLPAETMSDGLIYVAPDGGFIRSVRENGSGKIALFLKTPAMTEPMPLPTPVPWSGLVLVDGAAMWLDWDKRDYTLRRLGPGQASAVPVLRPQPMSLEVLGADAGGGVMVSANYRTLAGIAPNGGIAWGPMEFAGVSPGHDSVRLLDGGWVAWDAYREEGRYRLAWELPHGRGAFELPLGRHFTAVAVAPDGRHVAISATRSLNIGAIPDSVTVLSTKDGRVLWKRTLPSYSRIGIAFLGPDRLAMDAHAEHRTDVEVLEVPR